MKRPLPGSNPTSVSDKLDKLDRHGWWNLFLHISCSTPSADPEPVPWMPTLAAKAVGQWLVWSGTTPPEVPHIQIPCLRTGTDLEFTVHEDHAARRGPD